MTDMLKMGAFVDLVSTDPALNAILFGQWELEQGERGGFLGQLAGIAKTDRGFPKNGGPEAVRKRRGDLGPDPEMFDAMGEAELDWAAL